jgi:tripartite-type tricarboxylate transporter receptor subunit TctC
MVVWRFFLVPRGTPQHVRDRLYEGFSQIKRDERFVTFAEQNHLLIIHHDGPEVIRRIRNDQINMERTLRELGLIQ